MKKNGKIIFIVCLLVLLLTACQKAGKEPDKGVLPIYTEAESTQLVQNDMDKMSFTLSKVYKTDKIMVDEKIDIGGILARKNDILLSDRYSDSVVLLDHQGKVLKNVGKKGSGNLEFLGPSRMTVYNDEIYIIDQDNFRVQVLSKDLEFVRSIPIKEEDGFNPTFRKNHIAVNKEGIYLSNTGDTMIGTNRGIEFYPANDGEYRYLATEFSGPITTYNETLYAINQMVSAPTDMTNKDGSVMSGPNWLFQYNKGDEFMRVVSPLSAGLMITDMVIQNDSIIAFSTSTASLLHFDIQGKYIETLANTENRDEVSYYLSSDKKDSYWLVFPESHELYHIYKK